jgi:hypothetical protein
VVIVLCLLVIVLAVVMSKGRGSRDAAEAMTVMAGLVICGGAVASLVGLGLGVGGLFQEDRNRTLAVVGLILNGLVLIGGVVLVILGMAFTRYR